MRLVSKLFVLLMSIMLCATCIYADRSTENFNRDWRFALGEQDPQVQQITYDDSKWKMICLPHDWAIAGPFNASENGYAGKLPWKGIGWYRKTFTLAKDYSGRKVYFDFGGVMAFPKVFINGQLAGEWDYGYMSFRVDATPHVKLGETNVIVVQADTRRHGTRWYPGAGLYRKVTLTICEPVHVGCWGMFITTPKVSDTSAMVRVRSTLDNHLADDADVTAEIQLHDPDGRQVTHKTIKGTIPADGAWDADVSLVIKNPQRWDVTSPNLYTAKVFLRRNRKMLDTYATTFGIRTFEFTADDGFHLNGRRLQLYGVNLHHDQGPLGAAFYPRAMERQLEIMKNMGVNALRTSHNPPALEVLDLCDRMGILVWDEAFDKWNTTSDRPRDVDLLEYNKKQLRNLLLRDRNHPSIVTWSLGNEIADIESNRSGQAREQVKTLADFVRKLDPTRPVAMGCYIPSAVGTRVLESLDLTGWNYARRYAPYRAFFPDKPIIYSESASTLSTRGFYKLPLPNTKTHYAADEHQVDSYDLNAAPWSDIPDKEFQLMADDSFVAGEFVWTGFDYIGEPTPFAQEARSSYFGIVDLCGIPKDRYYLYRSHWRPNETTLHIVPHWNWPGQKGKNIPVFVYTNGDSADLFLNGRSLGRRSKGQTTPKTVNFALEKTSSASSEETDKGNLAKLAFDGDSATRWCAADSSVTQWLQVDLGSVRSIGYLAIEFEKEEKNYGYEVRVSNDGSQWRTLVTKPTSQQPRWGGPKRAFHPVEGEARFVRIEFNQLTQRTWAGVCEFGVYPEKIESEYYNVTYQYRLRWNDVTYEPGRLEAVAYNDGIEIARKVTLTAGEPKAIRLTAERTQLAATGEDLSYILVEAVDAIGTLCPLADYMIRFAVDGPAQIAAVGNGNPLSLEPFQENYRKLFYGKAMLILRSVDGQTGRIQVEAHTEGLAPGRIYLSAVP